jgi:hypothetical protein
MELSGALAACCSFLSDVFKTVPRSLKVLEGWGNLTRPPAVPIHGVQAATLDGRLRLDTSSFTIALEILE